MIDGVRRCYSLLWYCVIKVTVFLKLCLRQLICGFWSVRNPVRFSVCLCLTAKTLKIRGSVNCLTVSRFCASVRAKRLPHIAFCCENAGERGFSGLRKSTFRSVRKPFLKCDKGSFVMRNVHYGMEIPIKRWQKRLFPVSSYSVSCIPEVLNSARVFCNHLWRHCRRHHA